MQRAADGSLLEREAVRVAEQFIADNGYTDLPPLADRRQLSFETIEWADNIDEMLRLRHNTLERKAYGVRRGKWGDPQGWTIAFRSKGEDQQTGRRVTMDGKGGGIRVEHKDFFLQAVEKKLEP